MLTSSMLRIMVPAACLAAALGGVALADEEMPSNVKTTTIGGTRILVDPMLGAKGSSVSAPTTVEGSTPSSPPRVVLSTSNPGPSTTRPSNACSPTPPNWSTGSWAGVPM